MFQAISFISLLTYLIKIDLININNKIVLIFDLFRVFPFDTDCWFVLIVNCWLVFFSRLLTDLLSEAAGRSIYIYISMLLTDLLSKAADRSIYIYLRLLTDLLSIRLLTDLLSIRLLTDILSKAADRSSI